MREAWRAYSRKGANKALEFGGAISESGSESVSVSKRWGRGFGHEKLDRIVAMLTKLGQRGYAVHEDQAQYTAGGDPDPDPDAEGNQDQADRQPLAPGDA